MLLMKRTSKNYRRHQRNKARLFVEPLEVRDLTNASLWLEPNDTISQASELVAPVTVASLDSVGQAVALGSIGDGQYGAADVDWYHFQLNGPAEVRLATLDQPGGQHFSSVLSLYNSDPGDNNSDPYDLLGHRLLVQADGTSSGGHASIDRKLGQGDYYVAVSGAGNFYFNPYIADSGLPGSTGDYELSATATILATDPAINPILAIDASPLVVRLDFNTDPDPNTFNNTTMHNDSTGAPVTIDWTRSFYTTGARTRAVAGPGADSWSIHIHRGRTRCG